ncbi:MAG: elongation factor G [Actinobacteria bacterium]|nr:elongation factor G [Actinomycetota bacterium]MCG2795549.1 elongation factor G [Actinomycetes bacterium]MBU4241477.1 elongation factor G [Actinomycetota bacterium]MBU4302520.1 elongation factor G [Actinomycetota bacterium]MBU4386077.1 elongation factor G [Actinomycetota bacterium]
MTLSGDSVIKNVGLFGHGGSGKTTLAEALLYTTGTINRMGDVEQGNTTTDFDEDEINRSISINSALAPVTWDGTRITLLDTPGYADFVGDAISAVRVVDTCAFVVSGVDGIEVQTEIMWEKAAVLGTPSFVFISKLDRERAGFDRVLEDVRETLGGNVIPINIPIGEEHDFRGVVDLLSQKAYELEKEGKSKEVPVPDSLEDALADGRNGLIEAVAETDDSLLEKYLDDVELSADEILEALKKGVLERSLIPVLCGSASKGIGIPELLDFIADVLPLPGELPDVVGTVPGSDEEVVLPRSPDAPMSALVFKTLADPYVGKLTYFRVFSGVFKSDSSVLNSTNGKAERVGQLFQVTGKEQSGVSELGPGELGAVSKLGNTATGDTLCDKKSPVVLPPIEYPAPLMSLAVEPKTKGDEDKLSTALGRLREEDPMLEVRRDTDVNQTLISGAGENHLDVVVAKMRRKFGVDVLTTIPKVPYKETIRKSVEAQGKHKKQTGGHGQFGHCFLRLEPLQRGEGFQFEDKIVGASIPRQYIPGVEKGVVASMQEGFLAGYPIVDMRVTVFDGSFHSVDSSEMAFKMAASKAVKAAMLDAEPVILEPIVNAQVTVTDKYMGDVIGDLNAKRGRIQGMQPKGKTQVVQAQVPLAEMSRYSIDLRSITGGRGVFTMEFSHYEQVPEHIAQKIIAMQERKKEED